MAADTRVRMMTATVSALQQHGVAGMSFTEILAQSGAARGAIYHHFPGGKGQLVAEAAARNGTEIRGLLEALPGETPADLVDAFLDAIRPVLAASAGGSGCAVAAVTVADAAELRLVASEAFDSWIGALAGRLTTAGLKTQDATDLATTLITLLEGAHVLCRAAGTVEPLERAARTAKVLVRAYAR